MRVMICDSGLLVNTTEANEKCVLDSLCLLHFYQKTLLERVPNAKSQRKLKLVLFVTMTCKRWLGTLSDVFWSVCSSSNSVQPARTGSCRNL